MNTITKTLTNLAFGYCLVSAGAHAASIQSLTVEEIGGTSGGLGTSANSSIGGEVRAYTPNGDLFSGNPYSFISAGSIDGAIIMNTVQANGAFTVRFTQDNGDYGYLNTSRGAPSGTIINGVMTLDLSGFTAEYGGYSFSASPNNNLVTSVSMIDANHYYYTADWSHFVVNGEVFDSVTGTPTSTFNGYTLAGHLEGVAAVPEAETYAMMLAGLGLVGLMAHRRRKLI